MVVQLSDASLCASATPLLFPFLLNRSACNESPDLLLNGEGGDVWIPSGSALDGLQCVFSVFLLSPYLLLGKRGRPRPKWLQLRSGWLRCQGQAPFRSCPLSISQWSHRSISPCSVKEAKRERPFPPSCACLRRCCLFCVSNSLWLRAVSSGSMPLWRSRPPALANSFSSPLVALVVAKPFLGEGVLGWGNLQKCALETHGAPGRIASASLV